MITGEQYRILRHKLGLSQSKLATELGSTTNTIYRIEKLDSVKPIYEYALRYLIERKYFRSIESN